MNYSHCNKKVELRTEIQTFSNGTKHIAAYCPECNKFIKYLAQNTPAGEKIMPFGRHDGKPLSEIPKEYLTWMHDNNVLKGSLGRAVKEILFGPETKNP